MLGKNGLWLALGTAAALVAAAALLLSRWQAGSERQVVAVLDQQIATLDDPSAAALVRSLRQHDLLALGTLANSLADQRPLVSAAAREAIGNLVADWKRLPASDAVPRLSALAEALADRYERLAPAQQQFARQIAQSLLLWPLEDADFPADELVAQCERILIAPAPLLPDLDEELESPVAENLPDESLPPIVAPQMATRPGRTPPAIEPEGTGQQEPAPVTQPPILSAPGKEEPVPAQESDPPRPQPPRQFIRPRVPPIPPPVEP
ncbi:MAG TPA: hypothetical protein VMP01_26660 [Pirellulaceae bacterium]|nr:hypothetical protein [Pirellulaceae bacterium]